MKPEGSPPAKLVTISESEIVELAQFIASQSGRESASVERHLRWFLLENPARDPQIPLGSGLRSPQGELVGCILSVPQVFRFQQQTLLIVGSSCFYVDERYRGSGGLVFLRFSSWVENGRYSETPPTPTQPGCGKLAVRFPSPIPIMSCWACCTGNA